MLEVRRSPIHGRGVFSTRRVTERSLLSTCPAFLVDNATRLAIHGSPLAGMFIDWDDEGTGALPLGLVSLVNHDGQPNCEVVLRDDDQLGPAVELWSLGALPAGEELTIDYLAGEPGHELWFRPR
jgi:hypothetical protein